MHNRSRHLFARAADHPEKLAIIYNEERFTFGDLADQVRQTAGGLARLGIAKDVRVGIMLPSSPEFIVIQQALHMLGAIVTPLNPSYRLGEICHAIMACSLDHIVLPAELLQQVPQGIDARRGSLRSVIVVDSPFLQSNGSTVSLRAAIGAGPPIEMPSPVEGDDVVMVLLTSATTGKAKGVMLTAANLGANYDATPAWLGITESAVILCALPLYNTFGLNQCINAMVVAGATMVLLPRFDAGACIHTIEQYECTFLPAVPTMLQKILDHPDAQPQRFTSLERIMTGGAPVPAALLRRLSVAAPNLEILTGYGLTEGTALVTLVSVRLGADGEVERGRTIGRVLDGMTVGIAAEDGTLLPTGAVGEIVIRGPNVMRGYHLADEETAAAITHGWLRSGDLGYIDCEGYAYIVDRKKDVIIRGGQNIYPADIEEVLYQIGGISEAAVVGMPDDMLGEVPIAFVVFGTATQVSVATILERCRTELAQFKIPVAVHIMHELPKGPTGKILRRALRPLLKTAA